MSEKVRTVEEIYDAALDLETDPERVAENERAGKRIAKILRERDDKKAESDK